MKRLIALAALAATAGAAHANLVVNGSFEANLQGANSWSIYPHLHGWTGAARGIELRNNVAGAAFHGVNFVELDTTGNSAIWQDIGTVVGGQYLLSFAYSARPHTGNTNDIQVFWNNQLLTTLAGSNGTASHQWQVYNFNVTGAGALTQLRFAAAGVSDSYGGSLDAVSVTAVPEPETYALLLAGLAVVGSLARRRRG